MFRNPSIAPVEDFLGGFLCKACQISFSIFVKNIDPDWRDNAKRDAEHFSIAWLAHTVAKGHKRFTH